MISAIRFLVSAVRCGVAYIDCDGTLVEKFPVPPGIEVPLLWWSENLQPTARKRGPILLCRLLKAMGVRLILWTNRGWQHEVVTRRALGRHWYLFDEVQFRGGLKIQDRLDGPVMEDDARYFICSRYASLLVR